MVAKQTTSATSTGTSGRAGTARPKAPAARPVLAEGAGRPSGPSIVTFIEESRAELRRVTWPTRQEVQNLTAAVIGMTIGIAVFLGLIDYILNFIIQPIIGTK